MKHPLARLVCAAMLALASTGSAWAADAGAMFADRCAGCHSLTGPAPDTVTGVRDRKGPDLFYAGNKYRAEWLEAWLTRPTRIRPAGMFYGRHIKVGDKWDQVDEGSLPKHPALNAAVAKAMTGLLMEQKWGSDLIAQAKPEAVELSDIMGDLLFEKFKGCIACHQSTPDYGGFSGPELYTAAKRLTPAFLYSYMENPQRWDPKIWMPNMGLKPNDLNKLVRYMELIVQ